MGPATARGWLTGAIVKMDFGARTEKEISWRGQKRAALAVIGNHDRVHDPLFTKKATVNNIPFPLIPLPAVRLLQSIPEDNCQ